MSIHVKNGTPAERESLCASCSNAHIERGYRQSEELVICRSTYPEHLVTFRVRECSGYIEKQRETLYEMKKIAWILDEHGHTRKMGFVPAKELQDKPAEVELIFDREH